MAICPFHLALKHLSELVYHSSMWRWLKPTKQYPLPVWRPLDGPRRTVTTFVRGQRTVILPQTCKDRETTLTDQSRHENCMLASLSIVNGPAMPRSTKKLNAKHIKVETYESSDILVEKSSQTRSEATHLLYLVHRRVASEPYRGILNQRRNSAKGKCLIWFMTLQET